MNLRSDNKKLKGMDKWILFSVILIVCFGIINIYLATKPYSYCITYVVKQSMFFGISLLALYLVVSINYAFLKRITPIFYWISILLLMAVLVLGKTVNGAQGWIALGPLSFQPAELAKISTIMMLGKILEEHEGKISDIKTFLILGFFAALPAGLIVIQPDMGMTMVLFFMVLGVFFIAGLDKRIIIGGFVCLVLGLFVALKVGLIQEYQLARIISFTKPDLDTSDSGYQLRLSLVGIGSGGVIGAQNSLENNGSGGYASQYVPEVETDFIFAQISEQWGTLGAFFLLMLYGILIFRMISIARTSKDAFGTTVAIGLTSYFLFAIWQNIGMTIGLMPITGITLPMISYGGSSLLTTIMSIGLVLNVGINRKNLYF